MLFTEPAFLFLFLPIVLVVSCLLRNGVTRNTWLVFASLMFYATHGQEFLRPLIASIVLNYAMAIAVQWQRGASERRARWLLGLTVAGNLTVILVYKYGDFLVGNANAIAVWWRLQPWPLPGITLPIGISFYTFHAISYVVDVWRRQATPQKNPLQAALYLLLFPQLIAGPIIRYREIADQLAERRLTWSGFAYGARRFVVGMGKKVLIADVLARPADDIFALAATGLTTPLAWLGILCYSLQIYFDFSGYSDMAIGVAAMLGFRFPENFNYPYVASSVRDFWRRWHMSLSRWFRDYLYLPLGGGRAGARRVYLNLIVVFLLCGLWHGASWTFVVWGLYHGVFLVAERLGFDKVLQRVPRLAVHAYALIVVSVGWVFFRAETLGDAFSFLGAMAGLPGGAAVPFDVGYFLDPFVAAVITAGLVGATPIGASVASRVLTLQPARPLTRFGVDVAVLTGWATLLLGAALSIASNSASPFIYFRF